MKVSDYTAAARDVEASLGKTATRAADLAWATCALLTREAKITVDIHFGHFITRSYVYLVLPGKYVVNVIVRPGDEFYVTMGGAGAGYHPDTIPRTVADYINNRANGAKE